MPPVTGADSNLGRLEQQAELVRTPQALSRSEFEHFEHGVTDQIEVVVSAVSYVPSSTTDQ
jgi:hypothetical protein